MKAALVAGATGFLGKKLIDRLSSIGVEVRPLVRTAKGLPGEVVWDGRSSGNWERALEGADVVYNLAGAPVAQRWSGSGRQAILASRVEPTLALKAAITKLNQAVTWVNASAVGFYGDTGERTVDEESEPGTGFLPETCKQWERAASEDLPDVVRLVLPRIGFVLGREGGGLPVLRKLARWGLGGRAGSGRQFVPWIHVDDVISALVRLGAGEVAGPVNLVAPNQTTNGDFMAEVRRSVGRSFGPPAPSLAVKLGGWLMGNPADLVLQGQRVNPTVLTKLGFEWAFPTLRAALNDLR